MKSLISVCLRGGGFFLSTTILKLRALRATDIVCFLPAIDQHEGSCSSQVLLRSATAIRWHLVLGLRACVAGGRRVALLRQLSEARSRWPQAEEMQQLSQHSVLQRGVSEDQLAKA